MSGTYVLLFFGVLFAMGTLQAAASNTAEEVRDAQRFQNEHLATIQGTDVDVTDVTVVDAVSCDVNVSVENAGSTKLSVAATDVFTDGAYEEDLPANAAVEGDDDTDLWLPGQRLEIDVGELPSAPDRVKVVAGPGVADATEVSGLVC